MSKNHWIRWTKIWRKNKSCFPDVHSPLDHRPYLARKTSWRRVREKEMKLDFQSLLPVPTLHGTRNPTLHDYIFILFILFLWTACQLIGHQITWQCQPWDTPSQDFAKLNLNPWNLVSRSQEWASSYQPLDVTDLHARILRIVAVAKILQWDKSSHRMWHDKLGYSLWHRSESEVWEDSSSAYNGK